MASFFPARGCVYTVGNQGSAGFFSVTGLTGTATQPLLVQGVTYMPSAIIQPIVALDNTKIIYTFGNNYGNLQVYGEMLLGIAGGGGTAVFGNLMSFYNTNVVSNSSAAIPISMPASTKGLIYLKGMQIGAIDPEFHIQPFSLICLSADQ